MLHKTLNIRRNAYLTRYSTGMGFPECHSRLFFMPIVEADGKLQIEERIQAILSGGTDHRSRGYSFRPDAEVSPEEEMKRLAFALRKY